MPGITSSTGLISGIATQDTIDRLLQIAARPRDLLISRNQSAQAEQAALSKVQALILGFQVNVQKLTKVATFEKQKATSSDDKVLTATVTGSPAPGNYTFGAVRLAQTQQLLSNPFASNSQPIGAGTVSFRFGGFVDKGISLDQLNSGNGFQAGILKITDRSGATAEIDLRYVQTVDDVLTTINNTTSISVQAVADGDRFRIIDRTGQTTSNLRVQDIGTGTTAASLGLAGIDVAANSADGQDVVALSNNASLREFNNGNGVSIRATLPDLRVTFRDGSAALDIDFQNEKSLGELLQTINAADPARIRAEIAPDGDHLRLIDLTAAGAGTFSVSSPLGGSLAEDLGLTGTAVGDTITSGRKLAGLKTSLVSSLQGGTGLGAIGSISITDRSGTIGSVNLAGAETLDDVIRLINGSGLGISARYNTARNGIELNDTTGLTASNLIVANADATNTADKLGIAANLAGTKVNSGGLDLQVISRSTSLDSLNGGKGVFKSSILFSDSNGSVGSLRLLDASVKTIGDVLDGINNLGIGIQAKINDAGDGIVLVDTAGGAGKLNVREVGSGRAAADLRILGESTSISVGGTTVQGINGSTTYSVTLDADDSLQDLVTKIKDLNVGVSASILNLGGGATPYRLFLASQRTGQAGALLFDTTQASISLSQIAAAQDALLALSPSATSQGILVSSSSNDFSNIVDGVRISLKGTSSSPVSLTVDSNTADVFDAVKRLAEDYNKLRAELDEQTRLNEKDQSHGPLFGSSELLRVESEFSSLLSGRINGAGSIRGLEELGLSLDRLGKLQLDEAQFKEKLAADPNGVKDFFTREKTGAAVRLNALIDQLAGTPTVDGKPKGKSLFDTRSQALQDRISANQTRIDLLAVRLESQRLLLTKQFNVMEQALARLQNNQSSITQLQNLALSITSSRKS